MGQNETTTNELLLRIKEKYKKRKPLCGCIKYSHTGV